MISLFHFFSIITDPYFDYTFVSSFPLERETDRVLTSSLLTHLLIQTG